jgi:predicted transcriptional regulator
MSCSIEQLLESQGLPVCVKKDYCVAEAINQMREHDFSRLPVIDGGNYPLGMVTYESIIRVVGDFARIKDFIHRSEYAKWN